MEISILVHDERWVLLSVFQLMKSFINLNISNRLILVRLMNTVFVGYTSLWITSSPWLSQSFEHIVLALSCGLTSRCLSCNISSILLKITSRFWSVPSASYTIFGDISMRSLIWIFSSRDSFLNLITKFLIDNHWIMKTHVTLIDSLFILARMYNSLSSLRWVASVFLVVAGASSDVTHVAHACCTVDDAWLRDSAALPVHLDLSFLHILWILFWRHLLKIWNIPSIKFPLRILRHISAWSTSVVGSTIHKIIVHNIVLELLSLFGWGLWRYITVSCCTQEAGSFVE